MSIEELHLTSAISQTQLFYSTIVREFIFNNSLALKQLSFLSPIQTEFTAKSRVVDNIQLISQIDLEQI